MLPNPQHRSQNPGTLEHVEPAGCKAGLRGYPLVNEQFAIENGP